MEIRNCSHAGVWSGLVWSGLVWSGIIHANRQFITYGYNRTDIVPVAESGPDRCRILRIKMQFVTCLKDQKGLISVDGAVQHRSEETEMLTRKFDKYSVLYSGSAVIPIKHCY